jgi:hypothetical protein
MENPRILIGTLYVDENERDSCERALAGQGYRDWSLRVFSGLENREAHRQLYQYFMDNRDKYELFIKLDADMVLRSPDSLALIVNEFKKNDNPDHVVFYVHDWISGLQIIGLHVFSNRVSWRMTDEQLFVDPDPMRPGAKKVIENFPSPIADHSPNPSPFQAFRFGVHRASKILQSGRWWVDSAQADFQWRLLTHVHDTWKREGDRRRVLALLGAQWVLTAHLKGARDGYTGDTVLQAYRSIEQLDDQSLAEHLSRAWQSSIGRLWLRYRETAFRSAFSSLGRTGVRFARRFRVPSR